MEERGERQGGREGEGDGCLPLFKFLNMPLVKVPKSFRK